MLTFFKKTLIALIFLLFFNCQVKAQWVAIPDAGFVNWLNNGIYASCMNGNLMDTTCAAIVNGTIVDCHSNSSNIQNLEGVQYFDSLQILTCYNNSFLSHIPNLPLGLLALNCSYCPISTLPTLPPNLNSIYCNNTLITSLPLLPNSLSILDCFQNNIASLPNLPSSLTELSCSDNLLTNLPTLPASLNILACDNNNLINLPNLPSGLGLLNCNNNSLVALPTLPNSLWKLDCSNNQLSCVPNLPYSLSSAFYFNLINNPFTCLPNYVPAMNGSGYLNYPLCSENDSINNPNNCSSFKGIYGNTFRDVNSDCLFNIGDSLTRNISIKLLDSANINISTFYSLSNGIYNFVLDTASYTVKIDTINKAYTYNCNSPGIDSSFNLTTITPLINDVNFNIACKQGFDVGVKSVTITNFVFPGLPHCLNSSAGDLSQWYNLNCASGISGSIVITVNGPLTFDSIPPGALTPTNITGNTFTYTIADFGALNLSSFAMWFTTDTSAQAGDQICVNVNVTPTVGDNDTTNNTYTYCYPVVNSYDPNDKQVYPTTVNPSYNGYFTYTINFQNIGSAPAQNIRVVDTLASNLDLSTFEIINYSHANTSTLTGNVATFRFPNIQLPDSTSNPEGSKGFIQYRIKPVANLPFGTQIENKADIYFDFNAPITTNTAVSTFNSTVGLSPNSSPQERGVTVYPNPGKEIFNLRFSGNSASTKTIEVFNLIGEKVFSGVTKADNSIVDLSKKENGIYVLRVCNATTVFTQRLIKQ